LLLGSLALTGCGAELDRSSKVETLRVIGVHKSASYARAGEEVSFSMLWHDPKGRDITPVWFAVPEAAVSLLVDPLAEQLDAEPLPDAATAALWQNSDVLLPLCTNPERDSYAGCLGLHALAFGSSPGAVALLSRPGDSLTLRAPVSIVSHPKFAGNGLPAVQDCPGQAGADAADAEGEPSLGAYTCGSIYHPPPDADDLPNFGSMFAFFALCAGQLEYDASVKEGFGLLCLDEDDEPLGPADFVFGYSQVFLYADLRNANPVLEGMLVDGEEASACLGLECLEDGDPPEECGDGVPCLDVCEEEDEDNCPEIKIKPIIPRSYDCDSGSCDNAERDELAQLAYGRSVGEQMWIRYYADQGEMASEVKLLNDATTGWNSDFGTELRLPQEAGPVRIWAVAYDNRGGQNWVRVDAVAQ
jgi:hypothetical protein